MSLVREPHPERMDASTRREQQSFAFLHRASIEQPDATRSKRPRDAHGQAKVS
jgi:hypothetical protein